MKKSVKIIFILFALVVVLFAIIGGFFWYKDYGCERLKTEYDIVQLTYYKCLSLCPLNSFNNQSYYFSSAYPPCFDYCQDKYSEFSDKNYDNVAVAKCLGEDNNPVGYALGQCRGKKDQNLCLEAVFLKYSEIIDLSNYQLGDYPKLDVFIENLTCNNGSVDVTVRYLGDYEISKTMFTIYGSGRSSRQEKEPLANGETTT